MVCFKFLHLKFSNNTNKHKLKSNLQKLEFSKHLVQITWGLTKCYTESIVNRMRDYGKIYSINFNYC